MKSLVCVLVTGTALILGASSARADEVAGAPEPARPSEPTPSFAASRAGLFATVWPGRDNLSMVIGAELHLQVARRTFLDLSYAGSFASVRDSTFANGDYMGFGNPTIGAHAALSPLPNLHFALGGGVTIPLLQDPNDQVSNAGFYGARSEGYYDLDRFARGHAAVRVSAAMDWHMAGPMFMRAELRPVLFIPTNDMYPVIGASRADLASTRRGEASLFIETAAEIEARASFGLGVGARFQAVSMPMEKDLLQTTVEPFLAMTPSQKGIYARVGVPMALDGDLGLGTEPNKLLAAKISVGGQW